MDAEFSESTFALTHEIINSKNNPVSIAPSFPSLREEGKRGGYDVAMEVSANPLFAI